jgi:NADH-quinone oxidoreductase subunit A
VKKELAFFQLFFRFIGFTLIFAQNFNIMENISTPVDFLPIIIQLLVAAAFVALTMILTQSIGPKRKTTDVKLTAFESGIEVIGNARQPFSIKYFLVAILFVLFDIEVIFMYPWAVNFREFGLNGLIEMFIFMGTLLLGFIYVVKKNALEWD